MKASPTFLAYAAAVGVLGVADFVALPLVRAAETSSPASVTVPLEERNASGISGTVTLSPQGNATMIHVTLFSAPSFLPALSLHSGFDCMDAPGSASRPIRLNPVSSGGVSQTIVAIPIGAFHSSHFVLDVRDATEQERFAQACARIGP